MTGLLGLIGLEIFRRPEISIEVVRAWIAGVVILEEKEDEVELIELATKRLLLIPRPPEIITAPVVEDVEGVELLKVLIPVNTLLLVSLILPEPPPEPPPELVST